jgi:hypothetical protein
MRDPACSQSGFPIGLDQIDRLRCGITQFDAFVPEYESLGAVWPSNLAAR